VIGIYKITNKITGEIYIGQSNDCERRIKEHQYPNRYRAGQDIDIAIHEIGAKNFSFEIIEECPLEKLNEREIYWIKFYNSKEKGYNRNSGGNQWSSGSDNGMAKLNEEDVKFIRTAYTNHKRQKDIYEYFKDKVSFSTFQTCWQGKTWSHIMPEVFTEENKQYYIYENSRGGTSTMARLADEEVIAIRTRYQIENARTIYEDYKDRMKYETFQQVLWGRTYKNLPIYKKKEKKWINI
jgi:group I intron endonuclease